MTKYKGYYIDGVVFKTKAEIDSFIKAEIIKKIKVLHDMMFSGRYSYAEMMKINEDITVREYRLHDEYGMEWSDIEEIPYTA